MFYPTLLLLMWIAILYVPHAAPVLIGLVLTCVAGDMWSTLEGGA